MQPKQVTDDLDKLIEILPETVQENLSNSKNQIELLEVILDLGRLPEARYPTRVVTLGEQIVSRNDLQEIVNRLGDFGSDNRAGIERTLHRISAIRNRKKNIIGLTCRVGRAVFGTVEMVRDLIKKNQSLLLMGRPGVGKTTVLREIARVLADELHRRVVIIDTSNEIAGDGDIPHPAIGKARRMQVSKPEQQHEVMIEAVENHMPEVIVIDEIGTELEAQAARTIAERGVQLIATAHGNTIANLIKNPTLSDLIGGIQSVTLGDDEAKRRHTQKTVLERAAEPTFQIAVEINTRSNWSIHTDVASTVDLLLRGHITQGQERALDENGFVQMVNKDSKETQSPLQRPKTPIKQISYPYKHSSNNNDEYSLQTKIKDLSISTSQTNEINKLKILCYGISRQLIEEIIRRHNWPVIWVESLNEASVILSVKHQLSNYHNIRRKAKESQLPIHVIKSNTPRQVERAIERLLTRIQKPNALSIPLKKRSNNSDDSLEGLEECRLALEKIVLPLGRPVDLLPRSTRVIQMQVDLITNYRLHSDVFTNANESHLRIYPP